MFILCKGNRLKTQPAAGKRSLGLHRKRKEEVSPAYQSSPSFHLKITCMYACLRGCGCHWPHVEARGQFGNSVISFRVSFKEPPRGIGFSSKCFCLLIHHANSLSFVLYLQNFIVVNRSLGVPHSCLADGKVLWFQHKDTLYTQRER